jgi:transposase
MAEKHGKTQRNALGDATLHVNNEKQADPAIKEAQIERALLALSRKEVDSILGAAKKFNVPFSTLHGRVNGRVSRQEARISQRRLTQAQEDVLIEWAINSSAKGEAWTRTQLREQVFTLTGIRVGEKWVRRFLIRHSEISAKRPRPLDPKRARAFNPMTVQAHFNLFEKIVNDYEIPPENIYNTDEKGVQLGGGKKASTMQRLYAADNQNPIVLKGDSLLLITVIETACADGTPCPPGIIMPPGATGEWHEVEGIGW